MRAVLMALAGCGGADRVHEQTLLYELAGDGAGGLYFTAGVGSESNPGRVGHLSAGGVHTELVGGLPDAARFPVVDGDVVWVADPLGGPIQRVPTSGGDPEGVGDHAPGVSALAVDETDVYWLEWAWGTIGRMPKEGGAVVYVVGPEGSGATHTGAAEGTFVLDGDAIVWTEHERIRRAPKDGGAVVDLVPSRPEGTSGVEIIGSSWFTDVAVQGDDVVFAFHDQRRTPGAVMRVSKLGGEPTVIADGLGGPLRIAVADDAVYWTDPWGDDDEDRPGLVQRARDGVVETLHASRQPIEVLVEGDALYFTDTAEGAIYRNDR